MKINRPRLMLLVGVCLFPAAKAKIIMTDDPEELVLLENQKKYNPSKFEKKPIIYITSSSYVSPEIKKDFVFFAKPQFKNYECEFCKKLNTKIITPKARSP